VSLVLTPRQQRIVQAIRASVDSKGYPPTIREIAAAVGMNGPSGVAYQLRELERKGFLRRDPNSPRALALITPSTESENR